MQKAERDRTVRVLSSYSTTSCLNNRDKTWDDERDGKGRKWSAENGDCDAIWKGTENIAGYSDFSWDVNLSYTGTLCTDCFPTMRAGSYIHAYEPSGWRRMRFRAFGGIEARASFPMHFASAVHNLCPVRSACFPCDSIDAHHRSSRFVHHVPFSNTRTGLIRVPRTNYTGYAVDSMRPRCGDYSGVFVSPREDSTPIWKCLIELCSSPNRGASTNFYNRGNGLSVAFRGEHAKGRRLWQGAYWSAFTEAARSSISGRNKTFRYILRMLLHR